MKKIIKTALFLIFIMAATSLVAAAGLSESAEAETTPLVIKAEDSVTGYEVKFCFPDDGYDRVRIEGEWSFTDAIHASSATSLRATPFEWEDGMFPIHNAKVTYDMELNEGTDSWEITLPLPNGTFCYTFYIDGVEGAAIQDYTDTVRSWDPGNPPYGANNETDYDKMLQYSNRFFQSSVYVPRDETKQANTADHTLEAPRTDGNTGTVQFLKTDVSEEVGEQPYGLYLPDDFDVNRYNKYPVMFLVHGGGNDQSQWFTAGAAAHILDNMIFQKRVEPTIVVTLNGTIQGWNFPNIMLTLDSILEDVIATYNVSPEVSRHAFTGLSMGGMTTSYALYSRVESFDYFGIMSACFSMLTRFAPEVEDFDYGAAILKDKHILLSAGTSDGALYNDIIPAQRDFADAGTPFISRIIQGGHDWDLWTQLLAWELENFMWK